MKNVKSSLTEYKEFKIFRPAYRPFIMGGNVNAPMFVMMRPEKIVELSKDVNIGAFRHKDKVVICELSSGAVVGDNLNETITDFKAGDKKIIKEQIKNAKRELEPERGAFMTTLDKFFKIVPLNTLDN